MAKRKSKLKFIYDAPVTVTFALLTVLLFILDVFLFKNKLNSSFLFTPTAADGSFPFKFNELYSYLRLFLYVFGGSDRIILFSNLIFIMMLGPAIEERYGSVVIGLMIFVAALFAGVLAACCFKVPAFGAEPIVFMLILLNTMTHLSKKNISASSLGVICLFICYEVFKKNNNGMIGILVIIAGGLCGSLFAFMASPKNRATKKVSSTGEGLKNKAERLSENNSKKKNDGNDETIVGTIDF